jgi:hypothetical protein
MTAHQISITGTPSAKALAMAAAIAAITRADLNGRQAAANQAMAERESRWASLPKVAQAPTESREARRERDQAWVASQRAYLEAAHGQEAAKIINEIHCLEMSDFHDAANRQAVVVLTQRLASLTV